MLATTNLGSSIPVFTCFSQTESFWLAQIIVCLLISVGLVPQKGPFRRVRPFSNLPELLVKFQLVVEVLLFWIFLVSVAIFILFLTKLILNFVFMLEF